MAKNLQVKSSASKSRGSFTVSPSRVTEASVQLSNPLPVDNLISKGEIA